jgi:hypothetical protein
MLLFLLKNARAQNLFTFGNENTTSLCSDIKVVSSDSLASIKLSATFFFLKILYLTLARCLQFFKFL